MVGPISGQRSWLDDTGTVTENCRSWNVCKMPKPAALPRLHGPQVRSLKTAAAGMYAKCPNLQHCQDFMVHMVCTQICLSHWHKKITMSENVPETWPKSSVACIWTPIHIKWSAGLFPLPGPADSHGRYRGCSVAAGAWLYAKRARQAQQLALGLGPADMRVCVTALCPGASAARRKK